MLFRMPSLFMEALQGFLFGLERYKNSLNQSFATNLMHKYTHQESYIVQEASNVEKAKVFQVAEKLIADNNLPKNTKVTKLVEGIETAMFKQFFTHWNETENENAGFGRKYNPGAIAEWDITDLHFETRKRIARSAGGAIG